MTRPNRNIKLLYCVERSVVSSEDADALECWAEAGADLGALVDDNGRTALHVAADQGLDEHAKILMAHGADPLRQDSTGLTPIDVAKQHKHEDLAVLLQKVSLADQ